MFKLKPMFKCPENFKNQFRDARYFQSCVMLIDDTIQRHTMALENKKTADDFYEPSLKEGDDWLERSKDIYELLNIPRKILRWNSLVEFSKMMSLNEWCLNK